MRYSELPTLPPLPLGEQLPITRISPRPSLCKGQEVASLQELAESIRRYGLMRPVTVRRMGMGRYVIVSGNRRLAACRMLGMTCIGVRILSDDARWQPAERLLEALLMRRMHYLEEADALRALHEVHGIPWEALSGKLGVSAQRLERQAGLSGLADELQALLLEEGVPIRIALALMPVRGDKIRMEVAQRIVRERLCVRDAALLATAEARRDWRTAASKNEVNNRGKEESRNNTRKIVGVIRDHRLYINAIREIAGQLKAAGFGATVAERQVSGQMEMIIRVPVRRRRAERYQTI